MNTQAEMPFFALLPKVQFAPLHEVEKFESYRDAVVWVWENRAQKRGDQIADQAVCARYLGLYAPHMSRYVRRHSKSPMKLDPDVVPAFEAFCGWNAISQFMARKKQFTLLEQVIEERRQA